MKRIISLCMLVFVCAASSGALAQSTSDDRGYVQAFLEDNLSGVGREVRITGFSGALSSRAMIKELTIADANGVWLSLKDVVLDWNRTTLLGGRLEIGELSARELLLMRAPAPAIGQTRAPGFALPNLPAPEATPFSLPELPVAISIKKVTIAKVSVGEMLFGQAAEVHLKGAVDLANGEGKAALEITRIDGQAGEFALAGSYSNTTQLLDLSLTLSEGANGIAANLLGLPARPAVDLRIIGAGPISTFAADIELQTDGVRRLAGEVTLRSAENTAAQTDQHFSATLGGDLRALVQPQYHAYLGTDVRLNLNATRLGSGGFRIDALALKSGAVTVVGEAEFGPDAWPLRIDLTGSFTPADTPLPLPGQDIRAQQVSFTARYDGAKGNDWSITLAAANLQRSDASLSELILSGSGQLIQGNGAKIGQLSGAFDLKLAGLSLPGKALDNAIGTSLNGSLRFDLTEGGPMSLSAIALKGDDYSLSGAFVIYDLHDISNLAVTGKVALNADNLGRFAALAAVDLGGAADLAIAGEVAVLAGGFDLKIAGRTRNLSFGIARLDPLITGLGDLDMAVQRTDKGTNVERLIITTPHARISANALLTSIASAGYFDTLITDAGRIDPGLTGPTRISGGFQQNGPDWNLEITATGDGKAALALKGSAVVTDGVLQSVAGQASLQADDLRPYSGLATRQIGGGLNVKTDITADLITGGFAAAITGVGRDLTVGQNELDLLLRGASKFTSAFGRNPEGLVVLDTLELYNPQIHANATGEIFASERRLQFDLDLPNIGILYPDLNGPLAAKGVVSSGGQDYSVSSSLVGPGGMKAEIAGLIAADISHANLTIAGSAPIALANRFIAPNLTSGAAVFDLSLKGPLALTSVAGTIGVSNAHLSLPSLRLAFGDISATAQLGAGTARLTAVSNVSTGGQLSMAGPISLSAPYVTDLTVKLAAVGISEPGIYQTSVDGEIGLKGALVDGATISGELALGPVEIRVPETTAAANSGLSGLLHKNEPAAVRQTRLRAGRIDTGGTGGIAAAFPLDLKIHAPARIFIRGRGLDAELGGALRLRGTTADVIPEGRFDLIRGRLDILGKRLNLTEAFADLQGDFDPYLRIVSATESGGTNIQFVIEGIVSNLTVSISSSPSLPEDEILSRLLFGRELNKISALQALQIAAAVSTLAGGSGVGIVSRLREQFGLDDLDVSTSETGETGVRVGKYITENIYSDVTVNSEGKSEINLNLSVTPSVTARGTLTSDGNSGLGLFFEKDY